MSLGILPEHDAQSLLLPEHNAQRSEHKEVFAVFSPLLTSWYCLQTGKYCSRA